MLHLTSPECEDNSNDLILLRDKQESQTSICLRAVARGSRCGKRRSERGESKARIAAKCIPSPGSLLLPPRQLLSGAFLQGLVLSLETAARVLLTRPTFGPQMVTVVFVTF